MDGDDGAAARKGASTPSTATEHRRDARRRERPRRCLNQLRGAGCDMEIARESDGATAMGIHRARVLSRIGCIED